MLPHVFHASKLAVIVFAVLSVAYLLFSRQVITPADYHEIYRAAVSGKKVAFVEKVLETEIGGAIDNSALVELCKSKEWIPGLIFNCESPKGGVANVRNVFLNCVRYAIEAGVWLTTTATSFVIPEMVSRGTTLSTINTDTNVPFTYFFDLEHFTSSLSEACPQIHIVPNRNDLWDQPSTAKAILLTPNDLCDVLATPGDWSGAFKKYLNTIHPAPFSASIPVLVSLRSLLLQFPLSYDDALLVGNFGRMLRVREDVRRLAATVLYAMDKKFGMGVDSNLAGVQPGLFYGAHLRTAADAKAAGWTPFAQQAENYLNHARAKQLSTIYLSTGNEEDAKVFIETAATLSIDVTTKEELLGGKKFERELEEMKLLTWDQRGLIDYEVLLRSSVFGGTYESSFDWSVAMRRHVVVGNGRWAQIGGFVEEPESHKQDEEEGHEKKRLRARDEEEVPRVNEDHGSWQSFQEDLSTIFGPPGEGEMFELRMWP
ncbi:hypothetical protein LHYA1_G003013 [Lachnellula hyalina]|uniref:Alternative oxidase n=1 Tax=Lachnellula hyalina TaxID=1316788 RepID=A0A8H8R3U3_9HELO|nr:uncharacterized protein LHYA1_G003013 [Lachnellula hyalina]TVY27914.1 hypothetical protein LHYA1_G003013 [Lachnellula hyalina]